METTFDYWHLAPRHIGFPRVHASAGGMSLRLKHTILVLLTGTVPVLRVSLAHMAATCFGFILARRRPNFGTDDATCPVRALRRWLTNSSIIDGPVFRGVNRYGRPSRRGLHKDCVGWILKVAASRAGLKPEPLGGHSLRAGCVTQAAMNGVSERDIMRQTGHKSAEMLARYIRIGEMFTRNAAAGLGI